MAFIKINWPKMKFLAAAGFILFSLAFVSSVANAAPAGSTGRGSSQPQNPETGTVCNQGTCIDPAADPDAECDKDNCDFIKKYVNPTINLFSIVFGLIATASLIMGGIQYSASAGDPQNVAKAKKRIIDTIIAIVAFFFLYAFIQFLVPGGLF